MLGRKKADKTASPKKEKKAKRKSSGGSGSGDMKRWLTENIEKVLLCLIVLASVWIIYSGFNDAGLDTNQSTTDLDRQITQASSSISNSDWETVKSSRYQEVDRFEEQATQDTVEIKLDDYLVKKPLMPLLNKSRKLRSDPAVLAATDIQVQAGYGAMTTPREEDSLSRFAIEDENVRPLTDNLTKRFSGKSGAVRGVYFVSITGIVPIRAQLDLYNEAFIDAAGYDADRDFPTYLGLKIERREAGQKDWVELEKFGFSFDGDRQRETGADEVVADKYLLNNMVMGIPEVVGKDMTPFAMHAKVETQEVVEKRQQELEKADSRGGEGAGRRSEWRRGEGGRSEGRSGSERRSDESSAANEETMTDAEIAISRLSADIGMFRYFDLNVEPGQSYIYRVKLVIDDPNNPTAEGGFKRPSPEVCETVVVERRLAITDPHGQETEWSAPSSPIFVPSGGSVLASSSIAAKSVSKGSILKRDEPSATVLAVGWDNQRGMEIPIVVERARRGSVLNARVDAEGVDPSIGQIRKLKDHELRTGYMIADIDGGEELERGRTPVRSPGMILVVSPNGEVSIQHELADLDTYNSTVIGEDEELIRQREQMERERNERRRSGGRRGGRGEGGDGDRGRQRGEGGRNRGGSEPEQR